MVTNQMKVEAGLELHEVVGEEREYGGIRYEPKIVLWQGEWVTLPTIRHRKWAKNERQPKRRLRRQRRREHLNQKRIEERRLASVEDNTAVS